MGDANQPPKCRYCGQPFSQLRSTKEFCTATHRKSFFKRRKRSERRIRESARRAEMFMTFDGRTSGQPREGFGTKPHTRLRARPERPEYKFELELLKEEHQSLSVPEPREGLNSEKPKELKPKRVIYVRTDSRGRTQNVKNYSWLRVEVSKEK